MRANENTAHAELKNEAAATGACVSETLDYLMRRFGGQVMRLAYYHVRDRFLAEDIFQEVFYRVYLNLEKFRKDSSYFTWIYRITVNLCRDYKASAYFRRMLPWYNMEIKAPADDTRLFESAEGGEVFAKVMELPLNYRTAIALYYFDELTTPEISARLGIKEATVRTRLSRGRDMLREVLAREN
jgi:RNA polymerase sigma-70 factor (ECF subfamily)